MGELLRLLIGVALMWLRNRYDPATIRFREIGRIRHANETERLAIDKAVAVGDTAALSRIWAGLHGD